MPLCNFCLQLDFPKKNASSFQRCHTHYFSPLLLWFNPPVAKHHRVVAHTHPHQNGTAERNGKKVKLMDWDQDRKGMEAVIIIIISTATIEHTEQTTHNAIAHQLPAVQCSARHWAAAASSPQPVFSQHDASWDRTCLWPVWVSCPTAVPSQPFVPPPPAPCWQSSTRSWNSLSSV